eukprot:1521200-Prymnesium_polylepis.1
MALWHRWRPVLATPLCGNVTKRLLRRPAALTRSRMLTTTSAPTPPSPLWASTTIFGVANAIGFGMSAATGWHYHLDLIGTGAFTFAAAATSGGALRQRVSAAFVGLWATKLAAFLFYRALQTHHDSRLEKTLSTTKGAAGFWSASFAWGVVCFLPHSVAAGRAGPALGSVIGGLGLAAMATGLTLEVREPLDHTRDCCVPQRSTSFQGSVPYSYSSSS